MAETTCVLCSGGLDSVVLVWWAAERGAVQPVYVRAGLAWESEELKVLERTLPVGGGRVLPVAVLQFDVRDLYSPSHWAIRGTPPAYDTPDEDVYLPGRNVFLLSKAGVFAATHHVNKILLGPLAGN